MAIEATPPSTDTAPKAQAAARNTDGAASAKAGASGAQGGFPAMLSALADAGTDTPPDASAGSAPKDPCDTTVKNDAATDAPTTGTPAVPVASDKAPADLALLLAQSGMTTPAPVVPAALPTVPTPVPLPGASARSTTGVKLLATGSDAADKAGKSLFPAAGTAKAPTRPPAAFAAQAADANAKGTQAAAAASSTPQQQLAANANTNANADTASARNETSAAQLAAAMATAQQPAQPTATEATAAWRRVDRPGEQSGPASATVALPGSITDTQGNGSALMPTVTGAAAAANAGDAGLAHQMTQQVDYWLANKTQGAEMSIDVAGSGPVSVSVQVQGNEAHVVFRSDHAATRQMLADAKPQLDQMFAASGLTLGGVTVDAGAAGGNASQQQPDGTGVSTVGLAGKGGVSGPDAPAPVPRRVAERALDLYV